MAPEEITLENIPRQPLRAGDAQTAEHLKRENIRSAREWFQNYQKYLL
jgi:hypothetical protein